MQWAKPCAFNLLWVAKKSEHLRLNLNPLNFVRRIESRLFDITWNLTGWNGSSWVNRLDTQALNLRANLHHDTEPRSNVALKGIAFFFFSRWNEYSYDRDVFNAVQLFFVIPGDSNEIHMSSLFHFLSKAPSEGGSFMPIVCLHTLLKLQWYQEDRIEDDVLPHLSILADHCHLQPHWIDKLLRIAWRLPFFLYFIQDLLMSWYSDTRKTFSQANSAIYFLYSKQFIDDGT